MEQRRNRGGRPSKGERLTTSVRLPIALAMEMRAEAERRDLPRDRGLALREWNGCCTQRVRVNGAAVQRKGREGRKEMMSGAREQQEGRQTCMLTQRGLTHEEDHFSNTTSSASSCFCETGDNRP